MTVSDAIFRIGRTGWQVFACRNLQKLGECTQDDAKPRYIGLRLHRTRHNCALTYCDGQLITVMQCNAMQDAVLQAEKYPEASISGALAEVGIALPTPCNLQRLKSRY